MIRVLLVDDHQMFIEGMKAVLRTDDKIVVIGEALDGEEALSILKNSEIDVVVLDIAMPNKDGIETAKIIKEEYPHVKVLILTTYGEKEFAIKLMEIGVAGYILKNKSTDELVMAINNVYDGRSHYGLAVMDVIANTKRERKDDIRLTERELQVLCKIAEGYTSREIAEHLNISTTTVNTHRRNLLQKLDANNDKHLVRYAIKEGLVEL